MTIQGPDLLLGKVTDYPTQYNPSVLQPISRLLARESLPFGMNLGKGFDAWHVFEVSWLDENSKPQVAILRLIIPANSPNIVESKSLKLYFNSLNFNKFDSVEDLVSTVKKDLGRVVKATIEIEVFDVENLSTNSILSMYPNAQCIDNENLKQPLEQLLKIADVGKQKSLLTKNDTSVSEVLFSHLLRSNCPVTNQPDWGTVLIEYTGMQINKDDLLAYLSSFREHNGFHEQCVEQIFADITSELKPTSLLVRAWYTRRGGIDISPCRVSDYNLLPKPSRLARQ